MQKQIKPAPGGGGRTTARRDGSHLRTSSHSRARLLLSKLKCQCNSECKMPALLLRSSNHNLPLRLLLRIQIIRSGPPIRGRPVVPTVNRNLVRMGRKVSTRASNRNRVRMGRKVSTRASRACSNSSVRPFRWPIPIRLRDCKAWQRLLLLPCNSKHHHPCPLQACKA